MQTIFSNKISSTLIVFLVLLNIFSWVAYSARGRQLEEAQSSITNIEHSRNILAFQKLFVEKVLNAAGVVDYETRRSLEQAVGKTNDDAVIAAWNAFLGAKTEMEGQKRVKELLLAVAMRAY